MTHFAGFRANRSRGFSTIELVVAIAIIMIIAGMALPQLNAMLNAYRALGDARRIAGAMALARIRAGSDFTEARVYVNLTANTFRIDVWDKTGNGANPNGCWDTDGAAVGACDAPAAAATVVPQDVRFAQGIAPGFGAVTAAPPNTQAALAQAPACLNNAGAGIANTSCVVFNSRGFPVLPGNPNPGINNVPTGNDALYFTNNAGQTYGVTLTPGGKTSVWNFTNAWAQM